MGLARALRKSPQIVCSTACPAVLQCGACFTIYLPCWVSSEQHEQLCCLLCWAVVLLTLASPWQPHQRQQGLWLVGPVLVKNPLEQGCEVLKVRGVMFVQGLACCAEVVTGQGLFPSVLYN